MTIVKTKENNKLTVSLEGRLDTMTAPELEAALNDELQDISELIIDFEKLEYISSAGLRVMLSAHKEVSSHGEMIIIGANDEVKEIFDITGLVDMLNIQ